MPRLTRGLFLAAGISSISLVFYLASVLHRESPGSFFGSPLRGVVFLGLIFLFTITLVGALLLWQKPGLVAQLNQAVEPLVKANWFRPLFSYLAGLILLLCSIPLINILFGTDPRFRLILLRYSWLIFLLFALTTLGITYLSKAEKNLLLSAWLGSLLLFAISLIFQNRLLDQAALPQGTTQITLMLIQAGSAGAIWTFCFWLGGMSLSERKFWLLIFLLAAGLFFLEAVLLPRKLWFIRPVQAFFGTMIIFGAPVLTGGLTSLWQRLEQSTAGKIHRAAKGLLLISMILLANFYYQATAEHAQKINISLTFSDQDDYIKFIKTARDQNFHTTGDQNRMPGYPFFQALFYRPTMSDAELFEQGKRINIILSLIFLVLLFFLFLRYLSFYQAYLLLMIVSFSFYIFKAPYIQAEITFYFLSFLCFVLMIEMLTRPNWPLAIVTGLVAGLGYLTKGTLLPGVALFTVIFLIKEAINLVKQTRSPGWSSIRPSVLRLANLAITLIVFSGVIYPYISQMKQRFGNYLYNVNTSIYIWYDEMEQAYIGEDRYHFADGVPNNLPGDQIPSMRKYIREHTLQQALNRFKDGVRSELAVIGWQFSVTNYQLAYAWIFVLAILIDFKNCLRTLKKNPYAAAFGVLFFLGYFTAFAWYSPIASGRRFTYGLYIPFLFTVFAGINGLARQQTSDQAGGKSSLNLTRFFRTANLIIFLTLSYNIWVVLTTSLFFDRYGS